MMTCRLQIDRREQSDVDRILSWLHKRSPRGADAWHCAFWAPVMRITSDADSFALAEEAPTLGRDVRQAIFKTRRDRRYRIIFGFDASEVLVLRVRKPGQRLLRRRDLA